VSKNLRLLSEQELTSMVLVLWSDINKLNHSPIKAPPPLSFESYCYGVWCHFQQYFSYIIAVSYVQNNSTSF
jgi:hypothetical protein